RGAGHFGLAGNVALLRFNRHVDAEALVELIRRDHFGQAAQRRGYAKRAGHRGARTIDAQLGLEDAAGVGFKPDEPVGRQVAIAGAEEDGRPLVLLEAQTPDVRPHVPFVAHERPAEAGLILRLYEGERRKRIVERADARQVEAGAGLGNLARLGDGAARLFEEQLLQAIVAVADRLAVHLEDVPERLPDN